MRTSALDHREATVNRSHALRRSAGYPHLQFATTTRRGLRDRAALIEAAIRALSHAALDAVEPLRVPGSPVIEVDTTREVEIEALAAEVSLALRS